MPIYNTEDYVKLMRPLPKDWPKDIEGIPFVKKSTIDISNMDNGKWLINLSNTYSGDKNAYRKIVHCFKENNDLDRFYNKPYMLLEKVCKYYATSTLDFGMHPGMERAQIIEATFKNRWSGAWQQMNGHERVAVTVGWVFEDTYDICFAGIQDGTLLIISTLGVCNELSREIFLNGYREMRKRFPHSQILCMGNKLPEMNNDVCYIDYKHSFGNWDKYRDYWQPALFNWDGKEANNDVL